MNTIRRNNPRVKNLVANARKVVAYSLGNGFVGTEVELDRVPALFACFVDRTARYSANDSKVVVSVHSNLWYEVTDR